MSIPLASSANFPINITGQNLAVTEALEQHIKKKISKVVKKFNHITKIEVVLKTEKIQHKAEAEIFLAGKRGTLFAHASSKDMYISITEVADKLEKQITAHKEKLQNHSEGDVI